MAHSHDSERLHRMWVRFGHVADTAGDGPDAGAIAFPALFFLSSVEGQNGAVGPSVAALTIPPR
jgi:hypothetical protein